MGEGIRRSTEEFQAKESDQSCEFIPRSKQRAVLPKMQLQTVLSQSLFILLCSLARVFADTTIIDGPTNLTVQPGQWGNFTCRVACTHTVDWYVEGIPGDITTVCSESLNGQTVCMEETQRCPTESSTIGYISTLRVFAREEHAGVNIAVQCAAVARQFSTDPCPPYLSFSRFSFLRVAAPAENSTQAPTPSAPTPTPVVCPSVTTATETVTATVTKTVIIRETALPDLHSKASTAGSPFGRVVSEFLTWFVTIMAGIVFV